MSTLVTLAAAPDAVAPVLSSVCALLFFFIAIPLAIHDSPTAKKTKLPKGTVLDDQPLEDQVGA